MRTGYDLELVHLTKRYGDTVAVRDINHVFAPGSYVCLLGPSGCGKSSTLRMIAGHESVSEGSIVLDGSDVSSLSPAQRGTAMMFQNYALFPHLSVRDNVAFSLRMKGVDRETRHKQANDLLDLVQMSAFGDRQPAQLSGGQQQRVALWTNRCRRLTRSCASRCAPNLKSSSASSASSLFTSPTVRTRRSPSPTRSW